MRIGGLLGACRLTARWRVLTLAMVLGMLAAIVGVSSQIASAASVPHHHLRLGAHGAPGSGLTLAQAPAGLRAAVRRTLGLPAVPASSAFQQAKLTAADGAANDQLGWSVAISKSTAVVGAPGKNVNAGAAYVFVRSGTAWSQQAELTAAASDRFGTSVAIAGSTVVVGAVGNAGGTGAVYVFVRSGTAWSQQAELTAADAASGDAFGSSVAISGSTMAVGAPNKNLQTGAAYVFVRSGTAWSQQAELTAADGAANDLFGTSVAISGSTVVVGAYGHNSSTGAAYVFVRSGTAWSQQAELTAADAASGDSFGFSVAISGSMVVVGAYGKNSGIGAAYVFVRSGTAWSQQAELTDAGGAANDSFGFSVAISGSTVVVGTPGKNSNTGAAYVFVPSGTAWSQQAELTAADAASGDIFGFSVAISGSTAVAGARNKNSFTGAAYAFAVPSQQAELTAADAAAEDIFANSVAISGSTAVVGAPFKNSETGAAYVFVRSGTAWSQQAELTASDAAVNDRLGWSVAISGSTVVVGAPNKNSNTGAAYVFVRSGTAWSQQGKLTAADAAVNDLLGWSVAISGSTAVVGAPGRSGSTGAAYAYVRSGTVWSQQAELTAADGADFDEFGVSVGISGSTAVMGARVKNSNAGAAYVFVRSGTAWSQQAELTAADGAANDYFGTSVAIARSTVVVGAPSKNSSTGAAYVFVRSGTVWSQQAELTAADGASGDSFGTSVAISGTTAMVGAPNKDSSTGAAYVFARSGTAWPQQAKLTAADATAGDQFGYSVGISGPTAVVGAPNRNSGTGAAYAFVNV